MRVDLPITGLSEGASIASLSERIVAQIVGNGEAPAEGDAYTRLAARHGVDAEVASLVAAPPEGAVDAAASSRLGLLS
jgi:hypothetical protein